MELVQQWAGEITKECDTGGNTKEWYDELTQRCVDIGEVKSNEHATKQYLWLSQPNLLGVIGTVRSSKFMNGYPSDPDKNRPDLILSIHGIKLVPGLYSV